MKTFAILPKKGDRGSFRGLEHSGAASPVSAPFAKKAECGADGPSETHPKIQTTYLEGGIGHQRPQAVPPSGHRLAQDALGWVLCWCVQRKN